MIAKKQNKALKLEKIHMALIKAVSELMIMLKIKNLIGYNGSLGLIWRF